MTQRNNHTRDHAQDLAIFSHAPGTTSARSSFVMNKFVSLTRLSIICGATMCVCACTGALTDTQRGTAADAADPTSLAYRPVIQADLESLGCTAAADCHGQAGVPMTVLPAPTTDAEWLINFGEVKARAGSASASMLLTKPAGLGGHPEVLHPGSPILARWAEWIERGLPYEPE